MINMAIKEFFIQTQPERRRYGVALFVGVVAGIMSAFVKWGAEVPLPPRTFSGGRDEFNPPYLFLRDYLGIDPTHTVYTFSEHIINPVMVTHIIFSLVFAVGYCVVAEIFPKVKLWQGGVGRDCCYHCRSLDLISVTGPDAFLIEYSCR